MLTRDFALRVKALDDTGSFTGLASTYGPPADLAGDVIEAGSFKQSIQQQGDGYPLLWSHRTDEPIGLAKVSDSPAGLVVNAKLLMEDVGAQRAFAFIKAKVIRGISIGYTLPRGEGKVSYSDDGTRTLKEVRVHEISLVAVPANPRALVNPTSIKSLDQVENLLRGFRPADVKDDVLVQLRGVSAEVKRLLKKDDECECDCAECLDGNCENCSDDECDDPNCEGSVKSKAEELAALKAFALELKRYTP